MNEPNETATAEWAARRAEHTADATERASQYAAEAASLARAAAAAAAAIVTGESEAWRADATRAQRAAQRAEHYAIRAGAALAETEAWAIVEADDEGERS